MKIGTKVTRGSKTGFVLSYLPAYKACVTVQWSNGVTEGWFDANGSDGTPNAANHIVYHKTD